MNLFIGGLLIGFGLGVLVGLWYYDRFLRARKRKKNEAEDFSFAEYLLPGITDCPPMPKVKPPKTEKISLYKWVAKMDEQTCNECSELNGKIFTSKDIKNLCPPIHIDLGRSEYNCRCVLEPLYEREKDGN